MNHEPRKLSGQARQETREDVKDLRISLNFAGGGSDKMAVRKPAHKEMKSILQLLLVFVVASPRLLQAQGTTTFLSNLEQASAGSSAVGSDSWIAAVFFTGNNAGGYSLNSVQLGMVDASGSPANFTVTLYADANNPAGIRPGSSLGTLTGSANPASSGTYTYAAPANLILSPGLDYFIVITSATSIATGAYDWSLSGVNSYNPNGNWGVPSGISSGVFGSANGSSWNSLSATYPQFAVNATPTPEPGVVGLLAVGGLIVAMRRRIAKRCARISD
jgi:hypothetical protein